MLEELIFKGETSLVLKLPFLSNILKRFHFLIQLVTAAISKVGAAVLSMEEVLIQLFLNNLSLHTRMQANVLSIVLRHMRIAMLLMRWQ